MSTDRDHGPQPLAAIMQELGLKATDLVTASTDQLTHKAVARAMAGRWLTPHMQDKVRRALQRATGTQHALAALFTYAGRSAQQIVMPSPETRTPPPSPPQERA